MSNILSPGAKPHITADDAPLSGGILRFYEAGTLTPLTVYSDRELSTSLGSFVTLDSDGRATTPVFVPEGIPFKLRIETSGGSLISETDNQIALASSNQVQGLDAARQLIGYIPTVDPAVPAIGDGIADDSAALAAAINGSTQPVIDLGGKTFKINSSVAVTRGDITIRNGTIDMSGLTGASDMDAISFTGSEGSDVAFTGSALPGMATLTLTSTAGFAAGDTVYAYSSTDFASGCKLGELHRVLSITDATTLVLCRPLAFDFTGTGGLRKITPLSNILLEDVTFTGSIPADVSHFRKSLAFSRCRNVVLRRCVFDGPYSHGAEFSRCYRARIQDCVFQDITKTDTGRSVSVIEGCYDVRVSRSASENTRHLIFSGWFTSGVNQSIHLDGGNHSGIADIAFYDTNTYGCSVDQCLAEGSAGNGITVRGDILRVTGSIVRESALNGISFEPRREIGGGGNSCIISGNSIDGADRDGILVKTYSSGLGVKSAIITNNSLDGIAGTYGGIVINSATDGLAIEGVVVRGNSSIDDGASTHIKLFSSSSGSILRAVSCTGNSMLGGAIGVEISNTGTMQNVSVEAETQNGSVGVYLDNNAGGTMSDVSIGGNLAGTTHGAKLENAGGIQRLMVLGNLFGGIGVYFENAIGGTLEDVCVDGNIRGNTYGLQIVNAGTLARLEASGTMIGVTENGVDISNSGLAANVKIDSVSSGETYGCLVSHSGGNTFNSLSIHGQYSTGSDASAAGIFVTSGGAGDVYSGVDINARSSGVSYGTRLLLKENSDRITVSGAHSASSSNGTGLSVSGLSTATVARLASFYGSFEGGLNGFVNTMFIENGTFCGIAKGGDRGFWTSAFVGAVSGTFVGGTGAAFTNSSSSSRISLTGTTEGGTFGVDSGTGSVLCVGVQSAGFSTASTNGAGVVFGNAAAGHCLP